MGWKLKFLVITFILRTTQQDDLNENSIGANELTEQKIAEHINDLGIKILNELIEVNLGQNIVISPTTISVLLAMALLGSVGVTFEEIVKVIGFSSDVVSYRNHHVEFGQLLESLAADSSTKTSYANAIFVDNNSRLRDLYKEFTEKVYKGLITNVDFRNAAVTRDFINDWVKEHTNEKIPSFLNDPLPTDTEVVLLSALYFSGAWDKPFAPTYTRNMTFTKYDGQKIEAELMLNFGKFRHVFDEELDVNMVAIPYKGDETVMYVVKPGRQLGASLPNMLKRIDARKLDGLISQLSSKDCVLRFPKMSLKYQTDLRTPFQLLGIKSMFDDSAHFGLMIDDTLGKNSEENIILKIRDVDSSYDALSKLPNPGVHIDSIIHEVQITMDEYGTEAGAVAAGTLKRTAELFYADSPFYFFIRNERTKLVTFSAAIFDPTKN